MVPVNGATMCYVDSSALQHADNVFSCVNFLLMHYCQCHVTASEDLQTLKTVQVVMGPRA